MTPSLLISCSHPRYGHLSWPVREVIGRFLRHEPDRILQRLTRPEMIRREDADDDRLALTLEHPEEIAGLVRDREPGDVARNTRAVELAAHDAQHRIGCRLVDERAALHLLQQAAHFTRCR